MKKSIIALAVAGALTAPMVAQADATLYGSLRLKVVDVDGKTLNVADNASRIGIKGSVDTDMDGVKAIYRGEFKVNGSGGNEANFGEGRLAYVGLTGGFGTAAIGQQWSPEYNFATGVVDILDGTSSGTTVPTFRQSNMLSYVTPAMGGFQAALSAVANDNGVADTEDADSYTAAAKYSVAGFTAGAAFTGNETVNNADKTAVSVTYAADALYLAALYQDNETTADNTYELAGSYALGNTKLLASYADQGSDAKAYGIEVQQTLGKQARLFANYKDENKEAGDADTLSAGLRVDF